MSYLDHWAMQSPPRPQQAEVLEWAERSEARTLLVNAPTGVGKSPIIVTVAEADGGIILTPLKQLQDQYRRDWPDMPLLKGRQNYPCDHFSGSDCQSGAAAGCNAEACPYRSARGTFFGARAAVTNYAWLFAAMRQAEFELPSGEWLCCDEGHALEANLIGAAAVKVTLDIIKLLEFRETWPTDVTTSVSFMERMLTVVSVRIVQMSQECSVGGDAVDPDMAHNLVKLRMLSQSIEYFLESHEQETWVFSDDGDLMTFTLRPLTAQRLYSTYMEPLGRRILLASATLPEPRLLERWVGIADAERIDLPSPFDTANRTVRFAPAGDMSRSASTASLPAIANRIVKLLDAYKGHKGIIHSHSFKLTEQLSTMLRHHTGRVLVHARDTDRQNLIEHHLRSSEPTVLMSPSITEGLDLFDDLSRFTIFAKVPYAYLGDSWVAARMKEDPCWYAWQTMQAIIQGTGRSIRNVNDWADCWLIDSGFGSFWSKWGHLAPKWFADSVSM